MKIKLIQYIAAFLLLTILSACGPNAGDLDATSTSVANDIFGTQQFEGTANAEKTAEAQASLDAEATAAAEIELANQETAATQSAQATGQAQATQTEANRLARVTAIAQEATELVAATSTAEAAFEIVSTAMADPMMARIETLLADGQLSSSSGTYFPLDDFSENWPQLNWYRWWETGHEPTNFVVRADVDWESASETADWWNSGCGFVFRGQNTDNHYRAYLALDGNVYFNAVVNGRWVDLGRGYVGKIDNLSGAAEIMLLMEDDMMVFFVDGERVYGRSYGGLDDGYLAMTLASGTNKDYGTRCSFTNVDLWELE